MTRMCWSILVLPLIIGCAKSSGDDAASSTASTTSSSYPSVGSFKADTITVTSTDSVVHTGGDIRRLQLDSVIHTGGDVKAYLTAAGDDVMVNGSQKKKCESDIVWIQPVGKRAHGVLSCGAQPSGGKARR